MITWPVFFSIWRRVPWYPFNSSQIRINGFLQCPHDFILQPQLIKIIPAELVQIVITFKSCMFILASPTELLPHQQTTWTFIDVQASLFLLASWNRRHIVQFTFRDVLVQAKFAHVWHLLAGSHVYLFAASRFSLYTQTLWFLNCHLQHSRHRLYYTPALLRFGTWRDPRLLHTIVDVNPIDNWLQLLDIWLKFFELA